MRKNHSNTGSWWVSGWVFRWISGGFEDGFQGGLLGGFLDGFEDGFGVKLIVTFLAFVSSLGTEGVTMS